MSRLRGTAAILGVVYASAVACDDGLVSDPTGSTSAGAGGACVDQGAPCATLFHYPLGSEVSVELRGDFAPDGWDVGLPLQIDAGEWRVSLQAPNGGTIRYKYLVDGSEWVTDPTNPEQEDDGQGAKNSVKHVSCGGGQCAGEGGAGGGLVAGEFDWRSAILYFVFVDRFKNGDASNDEPVTGVETPANYQGGDWAGLLETIESGYFDELGVNALWLTVPMDNPSVAGAGSDGHAYSAYHGYWPSDLEATEEHFGDMALLKEVVDAAHARGMKVLFDYAMNHVHADSPLFSEHPDWFWPLDFDGKYCVCGDGCAWDGYEGRRCWFRDYLPDWNFQSPQARTASIDNAIWWIKETGIDGYRLDAVKHIETLWIEELRDRVDQEIDQSKGRFYMVGETFETTNRDAIRQYVSSDLLDGQFDFPLRGAIVEHVLRRSGSMQDLDGFLASNDGYYPGIMSTFIGNHDIARVINTALDQPWGTWDNGGSSGWDDPPGLPSNAAPFERLALGFTLLFTTRGVPLVYYGDEIGMPGAGDPDNRRMMQFEGLAANQQWLLDRMKLLGQIRRAQPALWRGTRTTVHADIDTYAFRMTDGASTLWVALNRGDSPGEVAGMPAESTDLISGDTVAGPSITVPPRTALILEP
jgi:glycosidase